MTKEEAIKIVRNIYQTDAEKEALAVLIPEIRESEDERIRKAIQLILIATEDEQKDFYSTHRLTRKDCTDWLERQKEQSWMPTEEEMGVLYKLCYVSAQISDDDDTELTRLYQDLKRECFNGRSFENMFPKAEAKFNVGDTIRLKNSYAEYTIESISDGKYYCKGCSIDIDGCDRDYELVRQNPIKVEVYEVGKGTTICGQDYKCKKDYQAGNCRYIKDAIYHCGRDGYLTDQNGVSWSCTPEWFKEYIQSNVEWAEEEKNRFVSGQFLQCKLSFDSFKEGEHYWLEYVGDDMYVGRSDNVLDQRFHITPRQLYTLFSQKLEEVQGPPQEEKQVSLTYEPPFNENASDKEIIEALIKHLKEQDGFLTAINCVSTKAILSWLEKQKENPDRLVLIGKAKSEKQVVLLAESNGDENIYWDTKSEEDAVSLLEKGLKFFGMQKPSDLSEMMVHKEPYIAPVSTPMVADERKPVECIDFYDEFYKVYTGPKNILAYANMFVKKLGYIPIDIHELSACVYYVIKHIEEDTKASQKEQKPSEWSEKDSLHLANAILSAEREWGNESCTAKWLKSLPERFNLKPKPAECSKATINGEPIPTENQSVDIPLPEWSEEDETAFGDLMWCIKQAAKSAKDENDMGNVWFAENWVKNRLKSLRPQPKAELTLLDKNIIEAAIAFVEQNNHFSCWGGIDKHMVIKALRSLKPHWKPTEEQIAAVEAAYSVLNSHDTWGEDEHLPTLMSLINDLQKLL